MSKSSKEIPKLQDRAAGVLMHPTSLPSRYGIGDLGPAAYEFVDFLHDAGQSWWQMLPTGPIGLGYSPYQPFSAFAGNPLLISLEVLRDEGLLTKDDLDLPDFPPRRVDYFKVAKYKHKCFDIAFGRFRATLKANGAFRDFEMANADWLHDFALFAALQQVHKGHPWMHWQRPLRQRERAALQQVRRDLHDAWLYQKFLQFEFSRQWKALKDYCGKKQIGLIGDLPIYVALDSADVWAHPELYRLNADGTPKVVAGVPPDMFSKTGQRWGNPLYDWAELKNQKYSWWVQRFSRLFSLFDVVRLDHFIGFHRYWEIPTSETTAVKGKFVMGPGAGFFSEVLKQLPKAEFIAEDLGIVVPEVTALREQFHLPGMKVLQFAFSGEPSENPYLPHKFNRESVVYTGTHDNDTTLSWFESGASKEEREFAVNYMGHPKGPVHWEMTRLAYASVCNTAIIPMQDLLGLGSDARMNFPGKVEGNWRWRMYPGAITEALTEQIRDLARLYER